MKPSRRLVSRTRQKVGTALSGQIPWPEQQERRSWAWLDSIRLAILPNLIRLRRRDRPFFTELHALLDRDGTITLGDLVEAAQEQTFGLLLLLLALPSLIPGLNVGAAPVGGLAIVWIGVQMALGRSVPALPLRLRRQPIHKGRVKDALARLEGYLERLGRGPRIRRMLNQRWMGFLIAWTGFLLAIPVPLPFGNLLPATILVLQGAALVEERPAWGWLGAAGALGNTIYFAASFNLILRACSKAVMVVRHWAS